MILNFFIFPRVNPSAQDNIAMCVASQNGYDAIVRLLLKTPRVDPSARDNFAIWSASEYGHLEVVRLLLEDPGWMLLCWNNNIVEISFSCF